MMKILAAACAIATILQPAADPRPVVAERVMRLTRDSAWRRVTAVLMRFRTFHPQGLVKIGDTLFVSSVETRDGTRESGSGHLFKFDMSGALLAHMTLGDGAIFHPGGLDYDGRHIWVAVAEYRPDSRSIVYRVDPDAMRATEVFRFDDHLGAIVHDTDDGSLHGVSWGSRRFYRWPIGADGRVTSGTTRKAAATTINASHYVDYQDCKYAAAGRMLCTGVAELRQTPPAAPFRLGGIDLVDLRDGRPLHQVPVLLWTPGGLDMTHNPVWIEPSATGLRVYFMPEDNASTLYVYDVDII